MIHSGAAAKIFDSDATGSYYANLPEISREHDIEAGVAQIESRFDAVIINTANFIRRTFPEDSSGRVAERFDATAAYMRI